MIAHHFQQCSHSFSRQFSILHAERRGRWQVSVLSKAIPRVCLRSNRCTSAWAAAPSSPTTGQWYRQLMRRTYGSFASDIAPCVGSWEIFFLSTALKCPASSQTSKLYLSSEKTSRLWLKLKLNARWALDFLKLRFCILMGTLHYYWNHYYWIKKQYLPHGAVIKRNRNWIWIRGFNLSNPGGIDPGFASSRANIFGFLHTNLIKFAAVITKVWLQTVYSFIRWARFYWRMADESASALLNGFV